MTFKIDAPEAFPIPTASRNRQRGDFAATADILEVGQSFFAPGRQAKGSYAALSPKKFPNKKFKLSTVTEMVDGAAVSGLRVWRTA